MKNTLGSHPQWRENPYLNLLAGGRIYPGRTARSKNKYNANIMVIMFVGKLSNLISGILVELFII